MMRSAHILATILLLACAVPGPVAARADIPAIQGRMRAFEAAGDFASAFTEARRLEDAVKAQFGERHQNYAVVLIVLGTLHERQARFAEAEAVYKRALAILERLKPSGAESAANLASDRSGALNNLAVVYKGQGRYAEAESLYRRALAIQEKRAGAPGREIARMLTNLGEVLRSQGKLDEAEATLRRAIAIYESPAGQPLPGRATGLSESLGTLGTVFMDRGRPVEAEPLLRRSLALREAMPDARATGVAASLVNLSGAVRALGRQTESMDLLQRALAIQERTFGPSHPVVATTLNNLAIGQEDQGRHTEAEGLHRRALAIREAAFGPDNPAVAQSLTNLAVVYRAQGKPDASAEMLQRALAIWEKSLGPNHQVVAGTLQNLAIADQARGRLAQAEAVLRRALAIQETILGPGHTDLSGTLNNLANVQTDRRLFTEAEAARRRALAIQEAALGPVHPDLVPTLNNLAAGLRLAGRPGPALEATRRASAIILAHAPIAEAGAGAVGGYLRQKADDFRRHVTVLAAAAKERPDSDLAREAFRMAQWATHSSAAGALQQTGARIAAGDPALAARIREGQDLSAAWSEADKALLAALAKPEAQRDRPAVAALRDRMTELRAKLAASDAALALSFPAYAALSRPRPLEVEEAQALLGPDEALAVLLPGETETDVFALTREGLTWRTVPLGGDALARGVVAFRKGLDVDGLNRSIEAGRPELFDREAAYALYAALLGPVDDRIAGKGHLLVAASGALTSLPFHLLITQKPEPAANADLSSYAKAAWLLRRQAVTVLPAVGSLTTLRSRPSREAEAKPLIGFADPVFARDPAPRVAALTSSVAAGRAVTRSYDAVWQGAGIDRERLAEALPPLPESADEVKAVAASLGASPADIFLGAAASEAAVKRADLAAYRIVYFATHGLVAGDVKGIAEPSLALSAPANPGPLDDGLLTASEVAALKLDADWVVLSACNTAAGEKPGAEALSGLARAFFYAGTRALLVSHWAVDSAAATRLAVATFDLLRADPALGRSQALRRAMLAYMDDASQARHAYPAYWGAFSIIGEGAGR